ncbi:MAG: hypothetical protein JNK89_04340, partial [Saprospiraceae bacterium]|nr:hypothetical protein [Saprospiraceae bacterium]
GGEGWIVDWRLDDPENGRLAAQVNDRIFALLPLPGTRQLLAGAMNGGLHWIDLDQPERTRNIQHHQKGIFDLKTDGDWLFSAGGEGLLTRWSIAEARSVESLQLSGQSLRVLALAPGRRELAVGASDSRIYLLDLDTLAIRAVIEAAHLPSVFALCYSPDERWLLSGGRDAMLRVWAAEKDFSLHAEQAAHLFTLNQIGYAPDGAYFATASRDKTVKIWDAANFKLLKVLETIRDGGHLNSVNRLLWMTKETLLSAGDDRSVLVWSLKFEV